MPPRPPLPPSVLVALGLTACGPCLSMVACLSQVQDTGPQDTDPPTPVGPCLDIADTGVGPCLSQVEDTGLEGTGDTSGSTADTGTTADTGGSPGPSPNAASAAARRDAVLQQLVDAGVLPDDVVARLRGGPR